MTKQINRLLGYGVFINFHEKQPTYDSEKWVQIDFAATLSIARRKVKALVKTYPYTPIQIRESRELIAK